MLVLLWLLLAHSEWKDKYVFKEQMPAAGVPGLSCRASGRPLCQGAGAAALEDSGSGWAKDLPGMWLRPHADSLGLEHGSATNLLQYLSRSGALLSFCWPSGPEVYSGPCGSALHSAWYSMELSEPVTHLVSGPQEVLGSLVPSSHRSQAKTCSGNTVGGVTSCNEAYGPGQEEGVM